MVTRHNTLQDLDFSADGRRLARAGLDGKILIWNVAGRAVERTIPTATRSSPSASRPTQNDRNRRPLRERQLLGSASGRAVGHTLGGQNGLVGSVATGQRERAHDDEQGRQVQALGHRLRAARRLASARRTTGGWGTSFPDGKHVIAVFSDGTGVVWNVDPTSWEEQACRVAHRNLTRAEWPTSCRSARTAPSVRSVAGVAHTAPALNL